MITPSQQFTHIEDGKLALAELSLIHLPGYKNWYYFNRLNVPAPIRGRGIAKKLMNQVVEWADQNQIYIHLDINPYGDLNLEQLTSFYKRYGFQEKDKKFMIRKPQQ